MKNFQCYFGEHEFNTLEFDRGLNLVIGNNGGGKSKLYDAFYWVLYDQIFNSDTRAFIGTGEYKEKLISEKARKNCDVGREVVTEVVLIAESVNGSEYKITRKLRATRASNNDWECKLPSLLLIEEKKSLTWTLQAAAKYDSILTRVIPGHLKPYMWFQGEQVHDLMDFNDTSRLTKAIDLLSNISDYDDLLKTLNSGKNTALNKYHVAQRKNSANEEKSSSLVIDIEAISRKIVALEHELKTNEENYDAANANFDALLGRIGDAEKKAELKSEYQSCKVEYLNAHELLKKKQLGLSKKMFSDYWVLKGTSGVIDNYTKKYGIYFSSHNAKENEAKEVYVKLPINIPQPIHVSKMLLEEKCFVCDRDAKKGSVEYKFIEKLLSRGDKPKENIFANNCEPFFSSVYNNAIGFKHLIDGVDRRVSEEFREIQTLQEKIDQKKDRMNEIDAQFDSLIEEDGSQDIVSAFKLHKNNMSKYLSYIEGNKTDLKSLDDRRSSNEEELSKLVTGEVDHQVKLSKEIFEKLVDVTESVRSEVFERIVEKLEIKANSLFKKMTAKNAAITGYIKLNKTKSGNYVPVIVGTDGNELTNPNDSNILLVKLALIMAVVHARGTKDISYALISDAPTSKMATEYSQGFYETLSTEYEQSIVMTYDFVDGGQRDYLKKLKIGSVYKVIANFPNGDVNDRSDLNILVQRESI